MTTPKKRSREEEQADENKKPKVKEFKNDEDDSRFVELYSFLKWAMKRLGGREYDDEEMGCANNAYEKAKNDYLTGFEDSEARYTHFYNFARWCIDSVGGHKFTYEEFAKLHAGYQMEEFDDLLRDTRKKLIGNEDEI